MHVGHLPVGDIHLLVIPQGQWKCDSISSSKNPWDVGLHHLRGEQRWALVHTLHEQKLQSWSGPELPWSLRTQGKLCLAVGPPGEISFSLLHLEMRTHMQGPTVSLGQWVIQ